MGVYDGMFYKFPKLEAENEMLAPVGAYFKGELSVPGSQLTLPYRAYTKPGVISAEPHFHREEEYLAFVGHDLRDAFESFDAEIEFWMGEDLASMEKYVITEPTMIRVPEFYWHGPIIIKRLGKPLFFQPVLYNSRSYAIRQRFDKEGRPYFDTAVEGRGVYSGKFDDGELVKLDDVNTGRYDHLVHKFIRTKNNWGEFMPQYQAYFRGRDHMEGANFYASYRCYMKEAFLDKISNYHSEEEYLCFVGYDMTDPFGSFDAEIEFWMGEDLDHMEKHIITEPTIVRIPAYMWHCPLEFKRVTKPVYFQVVHLRGKFSTFAAETDEDGKPYIKYAEVGGIRKCVQDPTKNCTLCGGCWRRAEEARLAAEAEKADK